MSLHCGSQTTFTEKSRDQVMNCPQTQASLDKAKETFILTSQRPPESNGHNSNYPQYSNINFEMFYHEEYTLDVWILQSEV